MVRGREHTSDFDNKDKWPVCKKCGKPSRSVFCDNGLCPSCDLEKDMTNKTNRRECCKINYTKEVNKNGFCVNWKM